MVLTAGAADAGLSVAPPGLSKQPHAMPSQVARALKLILWITLAQMAAGASVDGADTAACAVELVAGNASLVCSHGGIRAAADASLMRQLGVSGAKEQVEWVDDGSCAERLQSCMLVICGVRGDKVLELQLVISNVTGNWSRYQGILCITGNTKAVLQGAEVVANNMAGLVLDGSATVNITRSKFVKNVRMKGDGGAIMAMDNTTLYIAESTFLRNQAGRSSDPVTEDGGAVWATGNVHVTLEACTFSDNQAFNDWGGAVYVRDNVILKVIRCKVLSNTSNQGGALGAAGQARVAVSDSVFAGNWGGCGGAIHAAGNSRVTVLGSELVNNRVSDYDDPTYGGACCVNDTAILRFVDSTLRNNTSQDVGGGVAVVSPTAVLLVEGKTRLTANSAKQGGGLWITGPLHNPQAVAKATVGNKAIVSDDVGCDLKHLVVVNETIAPFRPRLDNNKGLLPVMLKLTGPDGIPGAADMHALLDGELVARGVSNPVNGEALLDVNLRKPPGNYTLRFEVMAMNDVLYTTMNITVTGCGPGEVTLTDQNACNPCPRGSYSLDPNLNQYSPCPSHALCEGSIITPMQGYWSSSMRSNQTHRCLYPRACIQNHTEAHLQSYQSWPLSYASEDAFKALQCIEGHEGNLCARCSPDYGQTLSAITSRCRPCAKPAKIVALYAVAALASMGFIKLLCFLNSQQGTTSPLAPSAGTLSHSASGATLIQSSSHNTAGGAKAANVDQDKAARQEDMHMRAAALKHTSNGVAAGAVAGVAATACSPHQGLSSGVQAASLPNSAAATAGTATVKPKGIVGHLLKPATIYLQWMLVLASINVSWPAVLSGPFSAVAWFFAFSSTSTGLDCLLSRSKHDSGLGLPMLKTLVGVCMPVALLAVLLCVDAASLKVHQLVWKRNRARARRFNAAYPTLQTGVFARTTIVVVFFFLPSLLRTVYGMFACVQLDAAPPSQQQSGHTYIVLNAVGSYWLLDTNQLCFQGYHRGWALGLGLPLLLLLCCGVPFGIIAYLYIRRQTLADPYYLQHYGFLYASYQPNRFYWEGVMALQTCVVVAISVFGATLGANYQCILLAAACYIAQALLGHFKPFAHKEVTLVATQAFGCMVLSALAALAINLLVEEGSSHADAAVGVGVAVLLINITLVFSFIWYALRAVDWVGLARVADNMDSIISRASARGFRWCASCMGAKQP